MIEEHERRVFFLFIGKNQSTVNRLYMKLTDHALHMKEIIKKKKKGNEKEIRKRRHETLEQSDHRRLE